MRRVLILIQVLFLVTACGKNNCRFSKSNSSIALFADLKTKNTIHRLYTPEEVDVAPHPFYQNQKGNPVYSFDNACGSGTFLFDPDTNQLEYAISYSKLSGAPVMMHFHLGDSTTEGPIIQTISGMPNGHVQGLGYSPDPPLSCSNPPTERAGFVTGVYKLAGNAELNPPLTIEAEKAALLNGEIYVNIHTYLNEEGEIRGQIAPCSPN